MSTENAQKIALASIESQPSSVTKLPPRTRSRPAADTLSNAPAAASARQEAPLAPANDEADTVALLREALKQRDERLATLEAKTVQVGKALREAQALYRQSSQKFNDFILSTSDWVWETDAAGRVQFISERITELLGRPAHMLQGSSFFDLGTLMEDGRGSSALGAMRARRPFRDLPMEFRAADGTTRRCYLSGMPVFGDETGKFVGYRGTGSDYTARFEAEQAARRSQHRLEYILEEVKNKNAHLEIAVANAEAAALAKTEFLANVSHELRTPLNAIIGFSEIMQREMFGQLGHKNYREYTDAILMSANHLLAVISDLLEMSRTEAGALTIDEAGIDVAEVVAACRQLMGETAKDKKLRLAVSLAPALPRIWGDTRLVKQMLLNLLSNSFKFTPAGGTITVEGSLRDDGRLALAVSDTGVGIARKNFEKVLSPFGQVESALNRTHEGTGLGLPLVKGMIERHGGQLELESELGKGTTVTLLFPRERVLAAVPEST